MTKSQMMFSDLLNSSSSVWKPLFGALMTISLLLVLLAPVKSEASHVVEGSGHQSISASGSDSGTFNLVLRDTGEIYGSGINGNGELGNGTGTASSVPVQVSTDGVLSGKKIVSISSGQNFSLALDENGVVYSWGANGAGQLGNGTTVASLVPVAVNASGFGGKKITAIAAGPAHALALDEDGQVYAWGANGNGQLGLGDDLFEGQLSPVAIGASGALAGLTIKAISAGGIDDGLDSSFSLALSDTGSVYSWGSNSQGQLGDGTTTIYRDAPAAISSAGSLSGKTYSAISAGSKSALAIDSIGAVYAWGDNTQGQLGNGTITGSSSPVAVDSSGVLSGKVIKQISAGHLFSLAVDEDGIGYSWGQNVSGELGDGTLTGSTVPVAMVATGQLAGEKITQVDAGYKASLALTQSGKVLAWGSDFDNQAGLDMGPYIARPQTNAFTGSLSGLSVSAISFGDNFALFLDSTGKVHGVGYNGDYRAGVPSPLRILDPVLVSVANGTLDQKTIVSISAGGSHSLALDSDGKVYAWGGNGFGQLGIGSTTSALPTLVEGVLAGKEIVQIEAGAFHSLALDSDGIVYAWGRNASGQLGVGTNDNSLVPLEVNSKGLLANKQVQTMVVGGSFSGGLTTSGEVFTWGNNRQGQLGNGTLDDSTLPINITNIGDLNTKNIVKIASGFFHMFALDSSNNVIAWGANYYGQLGDGTSTRSMTPKTITLGAIVGKSITSIDAGQDTSFAIDAAGVGYSWGYNDFGQLGTGDFISQYTPVLLSTSGALAGKTLKELGGHTGLQSYAIDTNNIPYVWGENPNEQLGIGTTDLYRVATRTAFLSHTPVVEPDPEPTEEQAPVTFTPAPYQGPIASGLPNSELTPGQSFTITGFRLNQVVSASIDNQNLEIISQTADSLELRLPVNLTPGTKNLVLLSSSGSLTVQSALTVKQVLVEDVPVFAEATTKLNAGSFKGFVAIYAKGHQGKRLSAKVGKDWIVVPSLKTGFERIIDQTGAGKKLNIKIYIDRKLIETMELTTK